MAGPRQSLSPPFAYGIGGGGGVPSALGEAMGTDQQLAARLPSASAGGLEASECIVPVVATNAFGSSSAAGGAGGIGDFVGAGRGGSSSSPQLTFMNNAGAFVSSSSHHNIVVSVIGGSGHGGGGPQHGSGGGGLAATNGTSGPFASAAAGGAAAPAHGSSSTFAVGSGHVNAPPHQLVFPPHNGGAAGLVSHRLSLGGGGSSFPFAYPAAPNVGNHSFAAGGPSPLSPSGATAANGHFSSANANLGGHPFSQQHQQQYPNQQQLPDSPQHQHQHQQQQQGMAMPIATAGNFTATNVSTLFGSRVPLIVFDACWGDGRGEQ